MRHVFPKRILIFPALIILMAAPHVASVSTYPPPADLSGIAHLKQSDAYTVTVSGRTGGELPSFVYMTPNYFGEKFKRSQTAVSFTSFACADEPVTVVVKCAVRVESAVIRPKRAGIRAEISGDTVRFTLDVPMKISLEVNDQLHPLLLFAESPETPDTGAAYYFAPGTVTKVGTKKEIKEGESVYIAGGAVVEGTFLSTGHNNSFRGRGILTSAYISWNEWNADKSLCQFSYPKFSSVRDHNFSGLICLNSPGWFHYGQLVSSTVRDIKFIAWNGNSDGLHLGGNCLMEDCFFFNNDDCLIANSGSSNTWRRCTIWRGPWGHPIISLLTKRTSRDYLWEDIDVIGMEGTGPVITLKNYKNWGKDGMVENFTVRNVRIESPRKGPLVKVEASTYSVKNFVLKDIIAETILDNEGLIALPAEGDTGTIEFQNIKLGGTAVNSIDKAKIACKGDMSGVRFKADAE